MILTPAVRILAVRLGYVDKTSKRKIHDQPIPHIGGAAIFAAFLIPFAGFLVYQNMITDVLIEYRAEVFGVLMGALTVFLIGVFDDIKGARARFKFIVEILAACIVYYAGVRILKLSNPFSETPFTFGHSVGLPLTVIWIVGVTNAVNMSDGIDGLAAGMAIFVSIVMFVLSLVNNHTLIALISITLAGSTAGFLVFNFPPAKIFMGDSGALFLGFMLGSISILGSVKGSAAVALVIPVLAMIVPISDTLMAMARRFLKGRGMMEADQDHVHHRLLKRGLSHTQIILVLYGVTIFFGLVALSLVYTQRRENGIVLGAVGILAVILIRRLGYSEFKVDRLTETIRESREERKRTREEREIIKGFETKAQNLSIPEIWEELAETVKLLGYTAVEIDPEQGTSLFRNNTEAEEDGTGERGRDLSFFWKSPDISADALDINWSLELPIYVFRDQKAAELKVYRQEADHSQLIHDEVILDLLCEVVRDCFDSKDSKKNAKKNQQ